MEVYTCEKGCCTVKIVPYIHGKKRYDKNQFRHLKAGVFIYDKDSDKVLLVQSRGNFWGPPKGSIEMYESESNCAIREVYEETGLHVKANSFIKAAKIQNRATYFYMEMSEVDVDIQNHIIGNDANGIGWIKLDCLEKFIRNGNISLSQHCRIIFSRFLNRFFSSSNFTKVKPRKRF